MSIERSPGVRAYLELAERGVPVGNTPPRLHHAASYCHLKGLVTTERPSPQLPPPVASFKAAGDIRPGDFLKDGGHERGVAVTDVRAVGGRVALIPRMGEPRVYPPDQRVQVWDRDPAPPERTYFVVLTDAGRLWLAERRLEDCEPAPAPDAPTEAPPVTTEGPPATPAAPPEPPRNQMDTPPIESDGPFEPFGFRWAGRLVEFSGATLRHRLLCSLWDSASGKPRPCEESGVIDHVYGDSEREAEGKLKNLCVETRKQLTRAGIALTIKSAGGKLWLEPSI